MLPRLLVDNAFVSLAMHFLAIHHMKMIFTLKNPAAADAALREQGILPIDGVGNLTCASWNQ